MPKHIIWDWNGTILDDRDACINSINRMLEARNLSSLDTQRYLDVFDFPVKNYYRQLGFDLEHEDWDAIAKEFHRHYANYSAAAPLRSDSLDTIRELHQRGIPMSILSASEISILENMLKKFSIRHFFVHVLGLDNLYAESKLHRGRGLLQELNLHPQDIIMVGDTNHDLDVANELGIDCILLEGGHQARSRLKGNTVLPSAKQLLEIF